MNKGTEIAATLLSGMVKEVSEWIDGRDKPGTKRPKVLALLPNELQSEVSLRRLESRRALGLEAPEPTPAIAPAAAQGSAASVTTS